MTEDDRASLNAYRRAWYARHKAANTSIYQRMIARQRQYSATHKTERHLWWARHRDANTATYQNSLDHSRARHANLTLAQYHARPRVQLACCGSWWPVTTLPHVCPRCGQHWLEETP